MSIKFALFLLLTFYCQTTFGQCSLEKHEKEGEYLVTMSASKPLGPLSMEDLTSTISETVDGETVSYSSSYTSKGLEFIVNAESMMNAFGWVENGEINVTKMFNDVSQLNNSPRITAMMSNEAILNACKIEAEITNPCKVTNQFLSCLLVQDST